MAAAVSDAEPPCIEQHGNAEPGHAFTRGIEDLKSECPGLACLLRGLSFCRKPCHKHSKGLKSVPWSSSPTQTQSS